MTPTHTPLRQPRSSLRCLNPIGPSLRHYGNEVQAIVSQTGGRSTYVELSRPDGRLGRARLAVRYLRELLSARGTHDHVLVLWPLFGAFDLALLRFASATTGRRYSLVVHDPTPLRRQFGLSAGAWRSMAVRFDGHRRVAVFCHSYEAREALTTLGLPSAAVTVIPHPILPPQPTRTGSQTEPVTVRVLGQAKGARDLELLAEIGAALTELEPSYRLEIVGSGWPSVPHWSITDAFVPESTFAELVRTASVVVVPYRRYYQSGVAIRALESGIPAVIPANTFASTLFGDNYVGSMATRSAADWAQAIVDVCSHPPELAIIHESYWLHCLATWAQLADT